KKWWKICQKELPFDPKYCWEINRHQSLPLLALAMKLNNGYALAAGKEFHNYLLAWFEENPPECGINWGSNLEVALRAISWCLAYWMIRPAGAQNDDFWPKYLSYLHHHGVHLEKYLFYTKACIPNNHLLGEVTALVLLGILFGKENWLNYRGLLEWLALEQFYPDGVNFEQSINYHQFSLKLLLLADVFLERIGHPCNQRIRERLGHALSFLRWVRKPDGAWPNIGDNDNGVVFPEGMEAIFLNGSSIHPGSTHEEGNSKFFTTGGFYVWRSGWDSDSSYLIVKAGPHKFHAHADLLHFEYSHQGESIFVDSGTYQYNKVPELRRYFRSTRDHNTATINEHDQSRPLNTFRWLSSAKTVDISFYEAGENCSIIFDAAVQFPGTKYIHRRVIETCRDLSPLSIFDWFKGGSKAAVYFHLSPDIQVEIHNNNSIKLIMPLGRKLFIQFESISAYSVKLESMPFAARYGEIKSHPVVCVSLINKLKHINLQTSISTDEIQAH
ncbi:MAG: alginate lyase family protein, partial [Desulfotomaculaceae bacterium]|nr:alginate lyase family protein [Desulfotomaculaceae bacterium]